MAMVRGAVSQKQKQKCLSCIVVLCSINLQYLGAYAGVPLEVIDVFICHNQLNGTSINSICRLLTCILYVRLFSCSIKDNKTVCCANYCRENSEFSASNFLCCSGDELSRSLNVVPEF